MNLVASRRLVALGAAATALSLGALIFPGAWLVLLALDLLIALIAVIDAWLTPRAALVDAVRQAPERLAALTPQTVAITVANRSRFVLWVRVRDTAPAYFAVMPEEWTGQVLAHHQVRWEYTIRPQTRGQFDWGPIHLRYRSPLGLWERQTVMPAAARSRVYPDLTLLDRYHLLARADQLESMGIRRLRLAGGNWEFESLREYAPGDDPRLIDWNATARRRKLIVRNQEAERNQTLLVLVDSGRLMNAEVDGVAKLDHAVNNALLLAYVALARGDRVGLCTFSHTVHAWVSPRAHRAQMRLLTEALYDLRGDFTESDHGRCLRALAARHAKRALLVVLTDFVDATTAAEMVAHLRLAGRRHVVLFAALRDPVLERTARSRPADGFTAFRKAVAVDLLHERREVLEQLRLHGAHVIDAEPGALTPPLLNRYLEITERGLL